MKSGLFSLLMVLLGTDAFAQDLCKRISRDVSSDKKSFEYSSPFDPQDPVSVHVSRSINIDPDYSLDNFFIIFRINCNLDDIYTKDSTGKQAEKEEQKIVVTFDDKTTVVDESITVSHDFTDDKMQAIRYVYFPLTETSVKDFINKKIVKFSLAGDEKTYQPDSAVCIQHYVQCINDTKKQQ